ncbi:MAG: hypothetical protein FJZ98_04245 [Chloroflexi bacterium]|nr:hypothetical protein [Chloroflexota bacterium]
MNKRTRGLWIILTILSIQLSACAGAGRNLVATATAEPSPTVKETDATPHPTITPASCDLPLPGPDDWMVLVCDKFDSDESVFPDESQDNPYANYTGATADGQYQLNYTAKNFAAFTRTAISWFDIATAQDFAVSVTGQMNTQFQEISWGIGFRGSGEKDSYFLFSIHNDSTYSFEIFENRAWIPLISRRPFSGMVPDQENKITVIAEGQSFRFLVNDTAVNFFNGGLLEGLELFLLVSVREGATVNFTFDDVVVQI